jgi:hypothetical protein
MLLRVSSLCELGWQPLLIAGMIVDQLRKHFGDLSAIESNDLRRYVWQDSEKTGILIESVYRWRGDVTELRPAILIGRNAYQSQRIAINDLTGINERQGTQDFTTLCIGSHTLFCIHGTGASVDILATEVKRELSGFAPAIREYLGLDKFQVTEVGAISEVEEAREHYVSPVTVAWAYQENQTLRYESLPLRRFPLSVLLDLEPFQIATGVRVR